MSIAQRGSTPARVGLALISVLMLAGLMPVGAFAVAPANPPTLTGPADSATVSANPVLSWSPLTGAAKYRVQISTSITFGTTIYSVDTVNTRATPPADLPLGTLYWRVAGMDSSSNLGPYSTVSSPRRGLAPTLTGPADGITLDFPSEPVLFSWEPLAGAKSYTLEIDDAADFIGATSFITVNTEFALTETPSIGQSSFWRVRATSATSGVVSDWSETRSYEFDWTAVPNLTYPANGATIEEVVLQWDPVLGAKTYQLQVSPNGDWANNITFDVAARRHPLLAARKRSSTARTSGASEPRTPRAPRTTAAGPRSGRSLAAGPREPSIAHPDWTAATRHRRGRPDLHVDPHPPGFALPDRVRRDQNFSAGSQLDAELHTNHTTFTPYPHGGDGAAAAAWCVTFERQRCRHGRLLARPRHRLRRLASSACGRTRRRTRSASSVHPGRVTMTDPNDGADVPPRPSTWGPVDNIERYRVTISRTTGPPRRCKYLSSPTGTSFTPSPARADEPFQWYVPDRSTAAASGVHPGSNGWWRHFIAERR